MRLRLLGRFIGFWGGWGGTFGLLRSVVRGLGLAVQAGVVVRRGVSSLRTVDCVARGCVLAGGHGLRVFSGGRGWVI